MTDRLKDRIAIVTGASSGIGRAIARTFAAHGATVVLADIRADSIEGGAPTEDLIREAGGRCVSIPTDVSDWDAVDGGWMAYWRETTPPVLTGPLFRWICVSAEGSRERVRICRNSGDQQSGRAQDGVHCRSPIMDSKARVPMGKISLAALQHNSEPGNCDLRAAHASTRS